MNVNSAQKGNQYQKVSSNFSSPKKVQAKDSTKEEVAVVYEKTNTENGSKKIYKRDQETIDKLKADAERRTQHLRDLVEKMMLQQGKTVVNGDDIYAFLREGNYEVDPEVKAQAQRDIAEDGYWGVEQTSDRMVSFAMALSGGDPSKADEMIAAVKKGFDAATKAWGGELPQISKNTLDATIKKLESWRDSLEN